ncbi:hypothetical protein C488_09579 [Natrinema pellirubrum DSM 15624]|uniref:Uncharacterized protein n=1 Tax=Natrinema pellirubrum (strain DSM 15624 / CIP 106293 / JCM 10476 / NCIMB 786 / 157) TaxID=797303 RepID=L0JR95_NATP1|nr:hypothetical protein [Natrinema pellirubrum]AGB32891.1 hypothetical protein Natpe_3098 [Natrinema pellirubrum DSM 15624]ELY75651.1 hypothetical protein C488_09579 [Natrinema pellirubrum DSM 15624]
MSSETDETLESYGADVGGPEGPLTRFHEWVLIQGNRLVVAALLSAVIFALIVGLYELGVINFVNGSSVTSVASGMIAGTFSLVTLVVSVNQLILSQEFGAAGKARDRFEGVVSFREDVAEEAAVPATPVAPTRVLELIIEAVRNDAAGLAAAVADHDDEVRETVVRYTNGVRERADRVDETLERSDFDTFSAVSAAIHYDEAWQLYAATHLRNDYHESLSPAAKAQLDELVDSLKLFSVAREQFKTTYLQRELTRFSQLTIYCGVPSILSAIVVGLLYADFAGPSLSVVALPYVVAALIVVVLSPLSLLVSYILRTATITRRTASVGPFVPQKDPDEGPFDVTAGEDR